jgi:hypothetical protein
VPLQFDASTKHLVETYLADWLPLSGRPPAPATVIDADLARVSAACDKLLRVDAAPPWLLHLELQAGHETGLADRLDLYNKLAEARHEVLVQTVLLLLRRAADSPHLTGLSGRGFPGEEAYRTFRYRVVRLWQEPVERLLTSGLGLVALAPLSDEAPPQLDAVIRRMDERFRAETEPAEVNDLWAASSLLMGLRYPRDLTRLVIQRVRVMRESSTYQVILDEGRAEGRAEGAAALRSALLELGEARFGPPPPDVVGSLSVVTDLDRLRRLTRRVIDITSWTELLAAP